MTTSRAVAQCAELIWAARLAGHTLDADATLGALDLSTAYAIQRAMLSLRLAAGERVVGWKLGYTAEVMRQQMGIDRPNHGPLTDWMLLGSDAAVSNRLVQPRVEPEIGLRLATAIDARSAPVDRATVAAAVAGAFACLEVVHSTWSGYRFTLEQNTADNSSAGQVVVGQRLPLLDFLALDTTTVRLNKGATTLGHGVGSDADGHPLDAVARLARELASVGLSLRAGDLVITGGLTAACPLGMGERIEASFSLPQGRSVQVSVRRQ
ncbi:MAG TPA: fumarylacetoacetate hydrolase family protein [Hydrogenophaga sp.]